MPHRIKIVAGPVSQLAELSEGPTAEQVWEALPIDGRANRWGEEIYFAIPVVAAQEPDASADVEVGELGYWPAGRAFCIFFGPTPASHDAEPRAASPVNRIGRVLGDPLAFRDVPDGAPVRLEAAT